MDKNILKDLVRENTRGLDEREVDDVTNALTSTFEAVSKEMAQFNQSGNSLYDVFKMFLFRANDALMPPLPDELSLQEWFCSAERRMYNMITSFSSLLPTLTYEYLKHSFTQITSTDEERKRIKQFIESCKPRYFDRIAELKRDANS